MERYGEKLEILSRYISNYSINLFNPGNISDYSIFKTDLQIIFGMLQYKEDKNALRSYMKDNEEYFSNMSYEAATATGTLLKNHTWFDRAVSKFSDKDKEVCDMCKAIDDMISDGRAEGKNEGILIGTVKAFRSIGWANDDIVSKLMEVYGVTAEDAMELVKG